MILFFGTRVRRRVLGSGSFRCPTCQVPRGYEHTEVRRWFHIFWVPIAPLGSPVEVVRCTGCGYEWDGAVLQTSRLG